MPMFLRFFVVPAAVLALATATASAASAGAAGAASAPATASASAPASSMHGQPKAKASAPAGPVHLVDINSAGRKELMTLPGIGAAEADKIIAGRPYLTKTELVTKNVLPMGPYASLKNLVVAMPPAKPKTPKA
jgi:competence protein ComEA